MSPLQKIAMGLVIVLGRASFPPRPSPEWAHYDALADPAGWVLVVLGCVALARANPAFGSSRWLATLAAVVSVPMWFPQLSHRLDASGGWFVSLPQLLFCLVLARQIGQEALLQEPRDAYAAQRFGLLVWAFGLAAVLPVIALGGGVTSLEVPTQLFAGACGVALVYFLFRVHRRPWLGGPGQLEVPPARRTG